VNTVVFTPSGRRGEVPDGASVLDAARALGVDLDSVCGGRGICGRCQVVPMAGSFPKHGITSAADHLMVLTGPPSETLGQVAQALIQRRELEHSLTKREREVLEIAAEGLTAREIEKAGIPFRLQVPHKAFNRKIGTLSGIRVSPDGRVVSDAEWDANVAQWLVSDEDRAFVASLMGRVVEPGQFAHWIAPPVMGINRQPIDFEYVRFG